MKTIPPPSLLGGILGVFLALVMTASIGCDSFSRGNLLVAFDYSTSWVDEGYKGIIFPSGTTLLMRNEPDNQIWRIDLSPEELSGIRRRLAAVGFSGLHSETRAKVFDGASTTIVVCREGLCHKVYEYEGETRAARTIRELYKALSDSLDDRVASAPTVSRRQAIAVIESEIQPGYRDAAEVFLVPLRQAHTHYPDDVYVCYDEELKSPYLSEERKPGCREQLVWNADQPRNREHYEGFVCSRGEIVFFTPAPWNEIGILPPLKTRGWCTPRAFTCKGTVAFVESKQCLPSNANPVLSPHEGALQSLAERCPAEAGIQVVGWSYHDDCQGAEGCHLRRSFVFSKTFLFEALATYRSSGTPAGSLPEGFLEERIFISGDTESEVSKPGLYCFEDGRVTTIATLTTVPTEESPAPTTTLTPSVLLVEG